jgi:hypothetical protein
MHEQTAGQVVAFSDRNEMLLSEADAAHVSFCRVPPPRGGGCTQAAIVPVLDGLAVRESRLRQCQSFSCTLLSQLANIDGMFCHPYPAHSKCFTSLVLFCPLG